MTKLSIAHMVCNNIGISDYCMPAILLIPSNDTSPY